MEYYILKNTKTKRYFRDYKGNKPIWTDLLTQAARYELELAQTMKKRLECQSQFVILIRDWHENNDFVVKAWNNENA